MANESIIEKTVQMLAPAEGTSDLASLLTYPLDPQQPFSSERRRTLANLSAKIFLDPVLKTDGPSVALAYWLRRANVDRLEASYQQLQNLRPDLLYVPVGRVFHIAPGNVDTQFVYSWALAYLCGNDNIVRLSGERSPVLTRLLQIISRQMEEDPVLRRGNWFLTYEHNRDISTELSLWCTHRVTWGGDSTVEAMRSLPLSAHASERAFGSKFSYGVISAHEYAIAEDSAAEKVASAFFNDLFWFHQMACSSPHLLYWVGNDSEFQSGITRFNAALDREIANRKFRGMPSDAMHRMSHAFQLATEIDVRIEGMGHEFLAARFSGLPQIPKTICGAGFFTHFQAESLMEVAGMVETRDQTITHFGFSSKELREFALRAGAKGADRIVPFGEALAFDVDWDGYDLVRDFLRGVVIHEHPTRH